MVTHMKTTIELPDALLEQLKDLAAQEGTTMRSLMEEALRRELDRRQNRADASSGFDLPLVGKGPARVVLPVGDKWYEMVYGDRL